MMGVLARLGDFRGLSRFTTWAYKFALLEAATKARRMAWRDRELPRPPEDWVAMADPDGRPEAAAEHAGRSMRASAPCWPPRGTDRRPLVERSRT
jgi:RNA polymerase sigma-70 factor, ECF subfamily